ncbi:MAG TPA: GIY-YIG nuclease family protein, partial [Ignavibacteria bacterium]|nr:GIY-YIG nuclease family protein [Ignavibacteria bacterium]
MDNNEILKDIFKNDPLGLLDIKPTVSAIKTEDERLIASFQEINDFYEINKREPEQINGVQEHQLISRLRAIRENPAKKEILKLYDKYGLLNFEQKDYKSIEDVFNDDSLGILNDDSEGLFDLKHVVKQDERANAEFIARRKPCRNFSKYEEIFKGVQKDLSEGKRKLLPFKQDNLREGDFYVHNGILLLLEKVKFEKDVQEFKSGKRIRVDGRTRVIFENGTESNMLYRSLYKVLLANGKAVSDNAETVNEKFVAKFSNITDDDKEAGYLYILKSKSEKTEIKTIHNLFKIGYSNIKIEDRIKNAKDEPTYLMDDVRIVMA